MSVIRALLATAVAMMLAVTSAPPTNAQTRRMLDKNNDAPPAVDIRWVRYRNATAAAVFTVKVDTLRRRTVIGGYLAEIGDIDGYEFRAWRTTAGVRHPVNYTFGASGARRIRCSRITTSWNNRRGIATVTLPRSCLRNVDGRLRMAADTSVPGRRWHSIDYAPEVRLRQG